MRLSELFEAKIKKQSPKKEELGDCFVIAGKNMINNKIPHMMLVHAMVTGQGDIEGVRHAHAWNELGGDVVLDQSNGGNYIGRRERYYEVGEVNEKDPTQYRRYNQDEALKWMVKTGNYGPWELKD